MKMVGYLILLGCQWPLHQTDEALVGHLIRGYETVVWISTDRAVCRYGLFFYTYGVYLHCGYEHSFISPHNGVINTSFQHYAHHARSPVELSTNLR